MVSTIETRQRASNKVDQRTSLTGRRGTQPITLAIDAMGGDSGPQVVLRGAALALDEGLSANLMFVGPTDQLANIKAEISALDSAQILDAPDVVSMNDKPAQVLRRGRETSMWHALNAVRSGQADAVVSGGNTGALMALSRHHLRMIPGVDRPAITAQWPTPRGRSVVLDVGANVEADVLQLLQFAIMGEAFVRILNDIQRPTVGLLNVGAEELKGHEVIREAAKMLRDVAPDIEFQGFVEGNDISNGAVDVVVTDGFSGNIALKSAEGAARLVGGWMKEAVTSNMLSKLGGLLMSSQLKMLRTRIDPSSVNGGVFLGINGVVVKSHGGADAAGVASALRIADNLARKAFIDDVAVRVGSVMERVCTQREEAQHIDTQPDEIKQTDDGATNAIKPTAPISDGVKSNSVSDQEDRANRDSTNVLQSPPKQASA